MAKRPTQPTAGPMAAVFDQALQGRTEPWAVQARNEARMRRVLARLGRPTDAASVRSAVARSRPELARWDAQVALGALVASDQIETARRVGRERGLTASRAVAQATATRQARARQAAADTALLGALDGRIATARAAARRPRRHFAIGAIARG